VLKINKTKEANLLFCGALRKKITISTFPTGYLALWRSLDLKTWECVPNATYERGGVKLRFTDPAPLRSRRSTRSGYEWLDLRLTFPSNP